MAVMQSAVAAVLRSENSHFQLRWEEASTSQKLLLAALADQPGRPMTGDYRRRHSLPTAAMAAPWDPDSDVFPTFADLPKIPGAPEGAAWFWGKDDNVSAAG